jgi:hypothetical protein
MGSRGPVERALYYNIGVMRIPRAAVLALIAAAAAAGCGSGGGLFPQYEYEEEIYLSLDGAATVYVNGSVPALDALRGASLNLDAHARLDREAVRRFYTTPVTHVAQISESRRSGRRFVHVKLDVDDVRRLGEAGPFNWSTYDLHLEGNHYLYRQSVGAAVHKSVGTVGWTGRELVAFRLHVPSLVDYHDGAGNLKRGNILVWEQTLGERLRGAPMVFDAQVRTQSILYGALGLFGATLVAVALMFGIVIWWVRRKGGTSDEGAEMAGKAG